MNPPPADLPDAPDYFPFEAGPFRQRMGLRPLPAGAWIEMDRNLSADLARKRELLAERPGEVLSLRATATDACRELLELLVRHLLLHFPQVYALEAGRLFNHVAGESWAWPIGSDGSERSPGPLELAARMVQEDWCILQPQFGTLRLTAGCVCFPSRWSLREKMGQSVWDIHGPVPGYGEQIGRPTDRFLDVMEADRLVWRLNWSLADTPELFRPDAPPMWASEPPTLEQVPERVWLRVERQTLRRLPASGAVAFSIRTHVRPLSDLRSRPREAALLAAALRAWPAEVVEYKGSRAVVGPAVAWLEEVASSAMNASGSRRVPRRRP